jgi:hypothetical protein
LGKPLEADPCLGWFEPLLERIRHRTSMTA